MRWRSAATAMGVTACAGAPSFAQGIFDPPVTHQVAYSPGGVVAADFNKDTWPDVAVANWYNGTTVSVLLGSAGGLAPPSSTPSVIGPAGL